MLKECNYHFTNGSYALSAQTVRFAVAVVPCYLEPQPQLLIYNPTLVRPLVFDRKTFPGGLCCVLFLKQSVPELYCLICECANIYSLETSFRFRVIPTSQQAQNICITFVQRRPYVFDVGPTLYKMSYKCIVFAGIPLLCYERLC